MASAKADAVTSGIGEEDRITLTLRESDLQSLATALLGDRQSTQKRKQLVAMLSASVKDGATGGGDNTIAFDLQKPAQTHEAYQEDSANELLKKMMEAGGENSAGTAPTETATGSFETCLAAIGIIGCGEICHSYVASLFRRPGARVTALFDKDTKRAQEMALICSQRGHAHVCSSLDEFLAREDVKIVINLTPVWHHYDVSHASLMAGKHVWSEKPLALQKNDAQRLVALAQERSLELGCSPLTYWGEAQQTMAHHLRRGLCGKIRFAQAHIHCGCWEPRQFRLFDWQNHPRLKIGSMQDVGIYAISLLTALLGEVKHVVGHSTQPDASDTSDTGSKSTSSTQALSDFYAAQLHFRSGAVAQMTTCLSFTTPQPRSLTLCGDDGVLTLKELWNFDTELSFTDATGKILQKRMHPWRPPTSKHAPHPHVTDWCRGVALMADSIDSGSSGRLFTGDHALHCVEILCAIDESIKQQKGIFIGNAEVDTLPSFVPLPMLPIHALPMRKPSWQSSVAASRVVFGTMDLRRANKPLELLDGVWALGCNAFDCAHIYGKGASENILGEWMATRGIERERCMLIGKGGHPNTATSKSRITQEDVEKDILESLSRLKTSYFDVYLLHRDDETVPMLKIVEMMSELVNRGLARAWGTSNFSSHRIQEALDCATANASFVAPLADSPQHSLCIPAHPIWPGTSYASKDCFNVYANTFRGSKEGESKKMSLFGWAGLSCGFLAGRWGDGSYISRSAAVADYGWIEAQQMRAICTRRNEKRRARAAVIAKKYATTTQAVSIAYALNRVESQYVDIFAVIGTTNLDHFAEIVEGASLKLPSTDIAFLEADDPADITRANVEGDEEKLPRSPKQDRNGKEKQAKARKDKDVKHSSSPEKTLKPTKSGHRLGNFPSYYKFNPVDGRMSMIPLDLPSWFCAPFYKMKVKDSTDATLQMLDLGCNSGDLSLAIWDLFRRHSMDGQQSEKQEDAFDGRNVKMLGVDIDESLIARAASASERYGSKSNVSFAVADVCDRSKIVKAAESAKFICDDRRKRVFDVISCFGLTMWVHINRGDESLKEFIKMICELSHCILIEPHPWKPYNKARNRLRRLKQPPPLEFENLKIRNGVDDWIHTFLTQNCHMTCVRKLGRTRWGRQVNAYKREQEDA